MKSKDKHLRRKARLARNRVLNTHQARMNELFYREDAGEDIVKGCVATTGSSHECLLCIEDKRFLEEWRQVERAVNW